MRNLARFLRPSGVPPGVFAYWHLAEGAGTGVVDSISQLAGVLGTTTAAPTWVTGPVLSFDGGDFLNIYSAALNSLFNGVTGTIAICAQVSAVGDWTDATARTAVALRVDANNLLGISKSATSNRLTFSYTAGGTPIAINKNSVSETNVMRLVMTWDKPADTVSAYYNGALVSSSTGLGTYSGGNLSTTLCCVGANSTSSGVPWKGITADLIIANRAFQSTDVAVLDRTLVRDITSRGLVAA